MINIASTRIPSTSRAVVINGVNKAALEKIPLPKPGPLDVVIKVAFTGICRTDLEILEGTLGYYHNDIANYPIVPGHEVSGVLVDVGSDVIEFEVGDRVVVECIQGCGDCRSCRRNFAIGCDERSELGVIRRNGGYSEFLIAPARFIHRLPHDCDLKKASLAEPLAVVLKGLRRLGSLCSGLDKLDMKCAVVGAGPLGQLCAMVLAARGYSVTLFDEDENRLRNIDRSMRTSRMLEGLCDFDVLIEATGEQSALTATLKESKAGASILLLGLPYELAPFSFEQIVAYDKFIVGSVGSSAADFAEALRLLPQLDSSSFTDVILPIEHFERGWDLVRKRAHLKVLLAPNGTDV